IHHRAGTHADPTRVPALARLAEQYQPRWDSPHPQLPALRDGKAVLIGDASDEYVRAHTVDAEHASLIRTLGFSSGIVVPLRSRERILGALTLVSASPGPPLPDGRPRAGGGAGPAGGHGRRQRAPLPRGAAGDPAARGVPGRR